MYCNPICDLSVSLHNFHSLVMNPWSICPVATLRGIAVKFLEGQGKISPDLIIVRFSHFEVENISLTNSIWE